MIENGELPAWLAELRDQQLEQQPEEQEQEPSPLADEPDFLDDLQDQQEQAVDAVPPKPEEAEQDQVPRDVLDDLRDQIKLTEDDYYEEPGRFYQPILDLQPVQRMTLSILLFLNVVLCGCMALVMAGRVVLPF